MNENLTLTDIETLARDVLIRAGTSPRNATHVARSLRLAERDNLRDAGLGRLPDVVEHLRCGRVNGKAVPVVSTPSPAAVHVDAQGGFACPAIAAGWTKLIGAANTHGIAVMTIRNSYPMTIPAHAAESCALVGLVGICFATTPVGRSIAMAMPKHDGPAQVIYDQATPGSAMVEMVQAIAGGAIDVDDFSGPVGGRIETGHTLIAISSDVQLGGVSAACQTALNRQATRTRTGNFGVGVPSSLLARIINA